MSVTPRQTKHEMVAVFIKPTEKKKKRFFMNFSHVAMTSVAGGRVAATQPVRRGGE